MEKIGDIDYKNIGQKIKELVCVLNRLPGIKTWKSCAGHSSDTCSYVEGYISFTVEGQEDLKNQKSVSVQSTVLG